MESHGFKRRNSILRRRRYSGYSSSYRRRRIHFASVLRAVLIAAILAAILFAGFMVHRAFQAETIITDLESKNKDLQQQVDELSAIVPDITLNQSMQEQTLSYQALYPEMKVDPTPSFAAPAEKTVYLTFDDGPSKNTIEILDALKAANQKATFFVIGRGIAGNEAVLKRMVDEGHTVGIHSFTHDYNTVYASVDAFLEDFHQTYEAIHTACGVYPTIFRFPGGSVNSYSRNVYQQIIAEMLRRGFVYYDWSISSGDADGTRYTAAQMMQAITAGVAKEPIPIVWMHDGVEKKTTAAALPQILRSLSDAGYTCAPLTNTVKPVTFNYSE